ncbi:hypothetical protein PIROE2DRAFT_33410, partial [Piromyces sp. E2]
MSFEIFWDKLDSDIALSFQNYLNDYFKKIKRPDFLGEVVFSDADFGQIPPEITIIDICDPMPEFYEEQYLGGTDNDYLSGQDDYNYEDEEIEKEMGEDYYASQINDKLPPRHNEWSSNFNRLSFNGFGNTFNNQNFIRTSSLQNLNQNFNALSLSDITKLDVVYRGNLKLTVSTALILNKPTPAFMTLPIKLALKGISFKG